MIKFKARGREYEIVGATIQDYYAIEDYLILSDRADSKMKIISQLSGATEGAVRELSMEELDRVWKLVENGPLSVNNTEFQREIEIDGTVYGFINLSKLTVGEMADMDTLRNHPNMSKQLHKMMAVLWRPVKDGAIEPYTTEGFEERAQEFLNKMPISSVLRSISFFFHIARVSLESMMDSLVEETKMENLQERKRKENERTSRSREAGHSSSTSWLVTTYLRLRRSRNYLSSRPLTTWLTERTKPRKKS
jgi:hypothetical protein